MRNVIFRLCVWIIISATIAFDTNRFVNVKNPVSLRLIAILDALVIRWAGKSRMVDLSFQVNHRRFIGKAACDRVFALVHGYNLSTGQFPAG